MIADVVRSLREARGWNQAELSRRAGLKSAQVSQIEAGKIRNLTHKTLGKLAAAFDLQVGDFMLLVAGTLPGPVDELRVEGVPGEALARLGGMWNDLTDEDREAVIAVTRQIWQGRMAQRGQSVFGPEDEVSTQEIA